MSKNTNDKQAILPSTRPIKEDKNEKQRATNSQNILVRLLTQAPSRLSIRALQTSVLCIRVPERFGFGRKALQDVGFVKELRAWRGRVCKQVSL